MPLATYSALRLGLLAACFALGYWVGLRTWLLLGVAVLVAWGLSYVLLAGPRDAAAAYVAERVERRRAGGGGRGRPDRDAAHEDDVLDRAGRLGEPPTRDSGEGLPGHPGDPGHRDHPGETASPRPNSTP